MKTIKNTTKQESNQVKKSILRGIIAATLPFVAILSSSQTVNAEAAKTFEGGNKYATRYELSFKVELSDWQYYLYEHPEAKMVYDTFSEVMDENGERVYPDEFIVGLLANMEYEGTPGLVENAFAKYHQYNFSLPSGGCAIQTKSDIAYLLNWTTSNEETVEGYAKKGSCGVSSLQWSYERRIEWLNILQEKMDEEKRFVCHEEDFFYANKEMFLKELDPHNDKYYNLVEKALEGTKQTPEDYAEAICDYYVKPNKADLGMSSKGSACKERRETATYIWSVFTNKNKQVYTHLIET